MPTNGDGIRALPAEVEEALADLRKAAWDDGAGAGGVFSRDPEHAMTAARSAILDALKAEHMAGLTREGPLWDRILKGEAALRAAEAREREAREALRALYDFYDGKAEEEGCYDGCGCGAVAALARARRVLSDAAPTGTGVDDQSD